MADQPFFSVVIPLYNKRPFVRRTLQTVLDQRHPSFEVIVVDDSSTDGSGEAIADLAGERVRIVRQPNAGPGAARNHGLALASGAWIAFLDADDLWTPGHLDALARIVAARPEARVIATRSRQLPAAEATQAPAEQRETAIRAIDYLADGGEAIVNASCVAVERTVFADHGGFGPFRLGEDEELWARLALHVSFAVSDAVTSTYLRANNGLMDRAVGDAGPPITVAISPVGQTLRAALADPALATRHAAVRGYLDRLNLRDARICLYAGYPAMARASLRALGAPRDITQALYWLLALAPRRLGRSGARAWPALRNRLGWLLVQAIPRRTVK